ncbi:MAG: methyltransferase RsmF C-terminal domain-like protein [Candidatus Woesearchaeota archaeon]
MHQVNTINNLRILNSKETKHLAERLLEQYGYDYDKKANGYVFLMNKDNRIYIISRNIADVPYDDMKIDSIGMYFGELYKDSLRLSIEGSQIIGPYADKNVIEIDKEQMLDWIRGMDVIYEDTGKDFIIIKHVNEESGKTDFLGAGKYKDGKIMNYVSKSRKLVVVNN